MLILMVQKVFGGKFWLENNSCLCSKSNLFYFAFCYKTEFTTKFTKNN